MKSLIFLFGLILAINSQAQDPFRKNSKATQFAAQALTELIDPNASSFTTKYSRITYVKNKVVQSYRENGLVWITGWNMRINRQTGKAEVFERYEGWGYQTNIPMDYDRDGDGVKERYYANIKEDKKTPDDNFDPETDNNTGCWNPVLPDITESAEHISYNLVAPVTISRSRLDTTRATLVITGFSNEAGIVHIIGTDKGIPFDFYRKPSGFTDKFNRQIENPYREEVIYSYYLLSKEPQSSGPNSYEYTGHSPNLSKDTGMKQHIEGIYN